MTRPDDALFRIRVETFALIRKLLPIALLVGALIGPLYRFEPTVAMWVSAVCFLAVLVGLLLASRLPLYPAHTFGIEYRLEEEPFDAGRRRCVRCDTLAESGTHRRYAKQLVALGVPLHTLEWGSNDFCPDCVPLADGVATSGGPAPDRSPESEPTPGRTATAEPDRTAGSERNSERERAPNVEPNAPTAATATPADPETPRLESARRVEGDDETTALELKRAFE